MPNSSNSAPVMAIQSQSQEIIVVIDRGVITVYQGTVHGHEQGHHAINLVVRVFLLREHVVVPVDVRDDV